SDRKFAARFLQIPRHHGHPCVKLTATSAFAARDSHPIDYTHAGRTQQKPLSIRKGVFACVKKLEKGQYFPDNIL
ncbi:hypothetical protein, partial [Peribacillus tepidiphilus]|uniref:hypothetical protein n=1 Tax=Peribacillus tepidiphilus TaxID=2652445 RepID=UPI001CDBDB04